jgi:hypothetical protein
MARLMREMRATWRRVARDRAGRRFVNHYRRAQKDRSRTTMALRLTAGTLLTAAGVFMWFVPGPGWLFVLFGLAMFATLWRRLAELLDSTELGLRAQGRGARRWWRSAAPAARAMVVVAALAVVAGVGSAAAWIVLG